MLDGISDIVDEVHTCQRNRQVLPLRSMLEELSALYSPCRVQELLIQQPAAVPGQTRRRATCLLRKAAIAAKTVNMARCREMRRLALEAVDGDEDEIFAMIEENRFCFTPPLEFTPESVTRVRHGFADA